MSATASNNTSLITIEYAQGLKDLHFLGANNPYVIITTGGASLRTKTIKSGGTDPQFNEGLVFTIPDDERSIYVRVMDQGSKQDTDLGAAYIDLTPVRSQGVNVSIQAPLVRPAKVKGGAGKIKGFLQLSIQMQYDASATPAKPVTGVPVNSSSNRSEVASSHHHEERRHYEGGHRYRSHGHGHGYGHGYYGHGHGFGFGFGGC